MKPSEALRLARDKVNNVAPKTYRYFICLILFELDTPGADKAKARIKDLLKPYKTYGKWLEHYDKEWHLKYRETPGAYIEARLCWIDDMIEYWESKGE